MRNRNWTEEEDILALCLYYELPTSKHDKNTPEVKALASLLGRSVGSVVFKLGNLKALDSTQTGTGFVHGAKMDKRVWDKYLDNPFDLFNKKNEILSEVYASENVADITPEHILPESETDKLLNEIDFTSEDKFKLQTWRDRQWAFRASLMKGYNEQCCLSGIRNPDFLVASHIIPWAIDKGNRINPRNGILLNVFLDKAFDKGYITVKSTDYSVMLSSHISDEKISRQLRIYEGRRIELPHNQDRWPEKEFLEYHNDVIFKH